MEANIVFSMKAKAHILNVIPKVNLSKKYDSHSHKYFYMCNYKQIFLDILIKKYE